MIRAVAHVARLVGLARILARHDALFLFARVPVIGALIPLLAFALGPVRARPGPRQGRRLAQALTEAGPSFIKLGQALSTRSDLIGEEMAADLSELQDRLPPFSGPEARAAIAREFGQPADALFSNFEDNAVAAASIAQVHFARARDGREVTVKVLRPGIEDKFRRDLDLFFWIAEWLERLRPEWRRLKPVESLNTLAETVAVEMDLRFEAAACAELAENFKDDANFRVPAVDWRLTGKRVLTTERVGGIPIDDRDAILAAGFEPKAVLAKAAAAFFMQVFRDGFFHADLHAGNLFVRGDGGIVAVDFGIMGRLDVRTRRYLGEMLLGFLNRDYRRVAEIHFEAGWVPGGQSVEAFALACRSIAEPIMDRPQNEISIARLLGLLFQITERFRMETQPQLLLLQKTMLVAEGTGRKLAPDANMWMLARPLIEAWMAERLGPEARLKETVDSLAGALERLPKILDRVEESSALIAEGRVKLHPETVSALAGDWSMRGGAVPIWAWALLALALVAILVLS
jgi:ubiquinone biosynthesis protein